MQIIRQFPIYALPDDQKTQQFRQSVFSIGCPVGDLINFDWLAGFIACQKPSFTLLGDNSVPIDLARNKIVEYFLIDHPETSHLLFWDLDTIPPWDGLYRLWKWDLPIVSGLYHQKIEPFYPLLMKRHAQSGTGFFSLIRWTDGELYEVDATGMGFVLIKREVFQQVDPPWFAFTDISEDFEFIQKAQKKGIKSYVDTSVKCKHLGDRTVTTDDFYRQQEKLISQGYIAERVPLFRRAGERVVANG